MQCDRGDFAVRAAPASLKQYIEVKSISPVCRYIIEIWPVVIACNWKKFRSACSILGQNITVSFGPIIAANGALLSASCHIALLLASFDAVLPTKREKPSWTDWTIEISPSTRLVLFSWFSARRSRFRVSHHATFCARLSCRSVVHTCSHFGARICARPRARRHRSLNILMAREPIGLSWRCLLLLLASHRVALTK